MFIPALFVAGILLFIVLNKPSVQSAVTPKQVAPTVHTTGDQKLTAKGITLATRILSKKQGSGDTKKFNSGDSVKVVVELKNLSEQQSRFLTIKTGLKPGNFLYMHNFQGVSGMTSENDEITFSNVVMNPGQVQSISFEAIISSAGNNEFEVKPSLVDITKQAVLYGQRIKYSIAKTDNLIGDSIQINEERE